MPSPIYVSQPGQPPRPMEKTLTASEIRQLAKLEQIRQPRPTCSGSCPTCKRHQP